VPVTVPGTALRDASGSGIRGRQTACRRVPCLRLDSAAGRDGSRPAGRLHMCCAP
jgi:hypothetical protein